MKHILLFVLMAILAGPAFAEPKDKQEPKRNFTIGKDTTYVTGPLDKDGRIDYVAALSERMGKGVTSETNANVMIWTALGPKPEGGKGQPAAFFKLMGMTEPPEKGDYFIELWRFAKEHLSVEDREELEELEEQCATAARIPWAAKSHPYIADWLKSIEKPLALFVEGMKRPHYFSPMVPSGAGGLISTLLPAVQKCRSATRALTARAMLRLHDGKTDAAWEDLMTCHRLARNLAKGSTLIEALVGMAIEQIAFKTGVAFLERPELDSKHLMKFLGDLKSLSRLPELGASMDGAERFGFLDTAMQVDRHGLNFLKDIGDLPDQVRIAKGPLEHMNWDPGLRKANKLFDRVSAALRLDTREKREVELDAIEEELLELKKSIKESVDLANVLMGAGVTPEYRGEVVGKLLLTYLTPSVRKVQTASDRSEQSHRNQQLAFAIAAYQRDQKSYPRSLADLTPKYLAKIPGDLFSGKEMFYRPNGNGFLIYSVGVNGIDDEGRWYDDEPRGDDPNVRVPAKK